MLTPDECRWGAMLHFLQILVPMCACLFLVGCSDMKFVNSTDASDGPDPREDIRLTGVEADLTSGALLQNRVHGTAGRYSEAQGLMLLSSVKVEAFDSKGSLQGLTNATSATIFLRDRADWQRAKSDMDFVGSVHHRVPNKQDPTSDSVVLDTDHLRWIQKEQRFKSESPYRMTMIQANGRSMVAMGDEFRASRDLRSWMVSHGAISTNLTSDVRAEAAKARAMSEAIVAESSGAPAAPQAAPIELPVDMAPPDTAQPGMRPVDIQSTVSKQIVGGRQLLRLNLPAPAQPAPTETTPEPPVETEVPALTPTPSPTPNPVLERAMQPRRSPRSTNRENR